MDPLNSQWTHLSDDSLLDLCREYGSQALVWRQKFIGLLPEVNRRELYKKRGFASVFEFAKKLAGISEDQIRLVLNLEKRFADKPILKNMLEKGEVSVNKLARIVSVANKENQEFLANQTKLLSKTSLETLVRDMKVEHENGLVKPKSSLPGQTFLSPDHERQDSVKPTGNRTSELKLSEEVQQQLLVLQNKGIDVNKMILEFLEKREQEITQEKEKIAAEEKQKLEHLQEIWKEENVKTSRYIPVQIKKIIAKEHGTKCSIQNCKKEATEIHHTQRFSLGKTHDPRFLAPFCHEHHQIAHSVDVKVQQKKLSAISSQNSGIPIFPKINT